MKNTLLQDVEYKITETASGTWKRFGYENGRTFSEYTSKATFGNLPMVHYTHGRNPETGHIKIAKGVLAVGRVAVGFIAVGQASVGVVAIGQAAFGILFGFGQLATGVVVIAQFAIALLFALGQFAIGHIAIGQFAVGEYALGQMAFGANTWDMRGGSEVAKEFFKGLLGR